MSGTVERDARWVLGDQRARKFSGALSGQVDVARPDHGVQQVRLDNRLLDGQLLCVQRGDAADDEADLPGPGNTTLWPLPLAEAYVRGVDLVARYEATIDWPYAPSIYWRADGLADGEQVRASLGLLISVETNLLDTRPQIDVRSRLAADELLHLGCNADGGNRATSLAAGRSHAIRPQDEPCCLLWRLAGGTISYAEMMPASDMHELVAVHQGDGQAEGCWRLFAQFLEKGVIRRARLQAAFLPREDDVALAAEYCRAVDRRPLPLTT